MLLFRHTDKQGAVKVTERLSVGLKPGYLRADSRSNSHSYFYYKLLTSGQFIPTSHVLCGQLTGHGVIFSPIKVKVFFLLFCYAPAEKKKESHLSCFIYICPFLIRVGIAITTRGHKILYNLFGMSIHNKLYLCGM